jgi:hypothetical protein
MCFKTFSFFCLWKKSKTATFGLCQFQQFSFPQLIRRNKSECISFRPGYKKTIHGGGYLLLSFLFAQKPIMEV